MGKTYLTEVIFIFADTRVSLDQSCKDEGFVYLEQALIMCEIMDTYTSRSGRVAHEESLENKIREIKKNQR